MKHVEDFDYIEVGGLIGALGALAKSLRTGLSFWLALIQSIIGGLISLAFGAIIFYLLKWPAELAFFCSGVVGIFSEIFVSWSHSLIGALSMYIQRKLFE